MSRDWLLYLDDIVQSAEKICRYVGDLSFEEFCANDMIFDAVLFNLQVIGEAAKKLPEAAKAAEILDAAQALLTRFDQEGRHELPDHR